MKRKKTGSKKPVNKNTVAFKKLSIDYARGFFGDKFVDAVLKEAEEKKSRAKGSDKPKRHDTA